MELFSFYQGQINDLQENIRKNRNKIRWIAAFRMLSFLIFCFGLFEYFKNTGPSFLVLSTIGIISFLWLVKRSISLKEEQSLLGKLLFINENEAGIIADKSNQFSPGTSEVEGESYLDDLDVFGPHSLFHLLNRTTTIHGKAALEKILKHPLENAEDILQYQQAVNHLSGQTTQRQLLTAQGLVHEENNGNLYSIREWLQMKEQAGSSVYLKYLRWVLPAYNVGSLLYYLSSGYLPTLLVGISVSILFTLNYLQRINTQHRLISKKQQILNQYAAILQIWSTVDSGSSVKIKELKEWSANAAQAIKSLSNLAGFFDQRLNMLVASLGNMIFMYDIQCLLFLEKWKTAHKEDFEKWVHCVGDMECLNSLATFAFNNPSFCYPVLKDKDLHLLASQIAHPLIPAAQRIPNDMEIGFQEQLQLITGSNMSGKTTFLRTIGINLLMAQCGLPVCAQSFVFSPMHILSCVRVSDSLQEHTSYFMAELKKLQQIIQYLQTGKPSLVLIDEILRGTNSEDKSHGSEQFIHKLLQFNCLALFATHDLSLSKMESANPGRIRNYCFESLIEKDELIFDYKLHSGVAQNRNASFLMKKMDII